MAGLHLQAAIAEQALPALSVVVLNGARVFADGEWTDVVGVAAAVEAELEWQGCFGFAGEITGQEME